MFAAIRSLSPGQRRQAKLLILLYPMLWVGALIFAVLYGVGFWASSKASAPAVPVTSTALCVAIISAAFFLRHVFAASAR